MSHLSVFVQMLSDKASSIYAHPHVHQFTCTKHTHNLCIITGKTTERPTQIVFIAASNGSEAGEFPLDHLDDCWIFQVGYHEDYGLTGALPDDRNSYPQGYRHGDTQHGEFFRLVGTRLRHDFFLGCRIPYR